MNSAARSGVARRSACGAIAAIILMLWLFVPHAAAQPQTRTIVDSARRKVEVPAKIERVFPAGPPATVFLYTLAPGKMLGWYRPLTVDERSFIPARWLELPTLGKLTGRSNTPNIDVVRDARPDVIVDYGAVGPRDAELADRIQQETGVPYVLIDGSLSEIPRAYRLVGDLLGVPERAGELAGYAERVLRDVDGRVMQVRPAERPRVYYARAPRGLQTELIESLARVGGRNVAVGTIARGPLVPIALEQAVAWNPDIIVTVDTEFSRTVRSDPAWQGVKAVRKGRIYLAPLVPFAWLDLPPSVNRLIGLKWLGRSLYPDLFPDDLREEARQFYALFYHRAPDEAQIAALLGPR